MMDADKNYSDLFLTFLIFQQELFYDIQPNNIIYGYMIRLPHMRFPQVGMSIESY